MSVMVRSSRTSPGPSARAGKCGYDHGSSSIPMRFPSNGRAIAAGHVRLPRLRPRPRDPRRGQAPRIDGLGRPHLPRRRRALEPRGAAASPRSPVPHAELPVRRRGRTASSSSTTRDAASGTLADGADGGGRFTEATLRPVVTHRGARGRSGARRRAARAGGASCASSRTRCNFPVRHEVRIVIASESPRGMYPLGARPRPSTCGGLGPFVPARRKGLPRAPHLRSSTSRHRTLVATSPRARRPARTRPPTGRTTPRPSSTASGAASDAITSTGDFGAQPEI